MADPKALIPPPRLVSQGSGPDKAKCANRRKNIRFLARTRLEPIQRTGASPSHLRRLQRQPVRKLIPSVPLFRGGPAVVGAHRRASIQRRSEHNMNKGGLSRQFFCNEVKRQVGARLCRRLFQQRATLPISAWRRGQNRSSERASAPLVSRHGRPGGAASAKPEIQAMISVFELFKIGIGPSSSHTVGPMKAAAAFASGLAAGPAIDEVAAVEVTLMGSLAFTGRGHATDKAVILGLMGQAPENVDPDAAEGLAAEVRSTKRIALAGRRLIAFDPATAIAFDTLTPAPRHPIRCGSSRRTRKATRSPTRPGSRSAAASSSATAPAMTRPRPRRACPIPSDRAPSFWRAGARPGFPSPRWCA
jgi:hypothetical protein